MQKFKKNSPALFAAQAGVIAAAYVVLTWVSSLAGLSSGAIQVRISEALCVLPAVTPAAIPALTLGCAIANLVTPGSMPLDVLFGSLATLAGALGAYFLAKAFRGKSSVFTDIAVTLPNLISNTLIIPWVLRLVYAAEGAIPYFMLTVGLGELISGTVLGSFLMYTLRKRVPHLTEKH